MLGFRGDRPLALAPLSLPILRGSFLDLLFQNFREGSLGHALISPRLPYIGGIFVLFSGTSAQV